MDAVQDNSGAVVRTTQTSELIRDSPHLRAVLGTFATGVTVVTAGGTQVHGMTANAFASVSLEPPLVLVCVDREAVMHDVLAAAGTFAVSVLAADQEGIARHFADRRRPRGIAQFDQVEWSPGARTGAPLIGGALAWLECGLRRTYDGGDHSIFVGEVRSADRGGSGEALVFFGSKFRQLTGGVQ